jgi:hypothetical protein
MKIKKIKKQIIEIQEKTKKPKSKQLMKRM